MKATRLSVRKGRILTPEETAKFDRLAELIKDAPPGRGLEAAFEAVREIEKAKRRPN